MTLNVMDGMVLWHLFVVVFTILYYTGAAVFHLMYLIFFVALWLNAYTSGYDNIWTARNIALSFWKTVAVITVVWFTRKPMKSLLRRCGIGRRPSPTPVNAEAGCQTVPQSAQDRLNSLLQSMKSTQGLGDQDSEIDSLCVICLDNKRSIVLLPCRHFILCKNCYRNGIHIKGFCPLCRGMIDRNVEVFR